MKARERKAGKNVKSSLALPNFDMLFFVTVIIFYLI